MSQEGTREVTVRDAHGALVTRELQPDEVLIRDAHRAPIKHRVEGDRVTRVAYHQNDLGEIIRQDQGDSKPMPRNGVIR